MPTGWRKHFWFLASRKVQVAVATVAVAIMTQYGWDVSEGTVTAIIAVGAALILGIAHEDNGRAAPTDGMERRAYWHASVPRG